MNIYVLVSYGRIIFTIALLFMYTSTATASTSHTTGATAFFSVLSLSASHSLPSTNPFDFLSASGPGAG